MVCSVYRVLHHLCVILSCTSVLFSLSIDLEVPSPSLRSPDVGLSGSSVVFRSFDSEVLESGLPEVLESGLPEVLESGLPS